VASEKVISDPGPTFEKGGRPHRPLEEAGGRPHNPLRDVGGTPDTGFAEADLVERRLDMLDRRTSLLEEAWRLRIAAAR